MSGHPERVEDYLEHMQEAIHRIQEYVEDLDFLAFSADGMVQDAVLRNLEIIGEADRKRYPGT